MVFINYSGAHRGEELNKQTGRKGEMPRDRFVGNRRAQTCPAVKHLQTEQGPSGLRRILRGLSWRRRRRIEARNGFKSLYGYEGSQLKLDERRVKDEEKQSEKTMAAEFVMFIEGCYEKERCRDQTFKGGENGEQERVKT